MAKEHLERGGRFISGGKTVFEDRPRTIFYFSEDNSLGGWRWGSQKGEFGDREYLDAKVPFLFPERWNEVNRNQFRYFLFFFSVLFIHHRTVPPTSRHPTITSHHTHTTQVSAEHSRDKNTHCLSAWAERMKSSRSGRRERSASTGAQELI